MKKIFSSVFSVAALFLFFLGGTTTLSAQIDGTKYADRVILGYIFDSYNSCLKRDPTQAELTKSFELYKDGTGPQKINDDICRPDRLNAESRGKELIETEVKATFKKCLGREPSGVELGAYSRDYDKTTSSVVSSKICSLDEALAYQRKQENVSSLVPNAKKDESLLEIVKDGDKNIEGAIDIAKKVGKIELETLKAVVSIHPVVINSKVSVRVLEQPLVQAKGGIKDTIDLVKNPTVNNAVDIVKNGIKREVDLVKDITKTVVTDPVVGTVNKIKDITRSVFGGGSDKPYMSQEKAQSIVISVYKDCLGRSPDASGMAEYTKTLMYSHGEKWVRDDVCGSAEAKSKNGGKPAQPTSKNYSSAINKIYNDCLGRSADSGGMSTYSREMSNGKSESWVRSQVCNSSEAKSKKDAPKVAAKQPVVVGGKSCGQLYKSKGYTAGSCSKGQKGYVNLGNTYDCKPCYGKK